MNTANWRWFLACAILPAGLASVPPARAQPPPDPPLLRVPRLAAAPQLDGRIEESEWKGASAWTGGLLVSAEHALAPVEMQASVWLGHDERFLYIAMRTPNPEGRYPIGRADRPDAPEILDDDYFQVILAPDERSRAGRSGEGYYRISVNPLGAVDDRWLNSGRADRELLWSFGGEARSVVSPSGWELEMSVAWSSVGVDAPNGRTVYAQFGLAGGRNDARAVRVWAPAVGNRPWEGWGVLEMTPGPTAQTLALGAVGAGELDAHIRAVGAPVRATLRLVNAAGETRLEETREGMEAQIRKEKLSLSDTGNTLEMEVRAAHEVVCRQRARVDRWTEAWLAKHLQPWREAHPAQPPRPEAFPEDHPTSFLVFLSAQRRRIRPLEVAYAAARQADDREAMGEIGRRLIREAPYFPAGYFIAALDAATRGRREEALDLLEKAVERGFNNARTLAESEELRPLADDPRFRALAARASSGRGMTIPAGAEPAEVTEPSVLADEKNITIHPQLGIPVALYRFAPQAPTDEPVTRLGGKTGELLRGWYAEGTAAGNWGDLYDNRDDGHSRLSARMFPQLTHIRYGARARECELHSGLASTLVHDGTLIGNASLAVTGGAFWRSLPRAAHVNPRVMALFFVQYRSGQLYVHPAHMDFPKDQSEEKGLDPKRRDVFFANAPFPLISRGSSGSDRPHLEALAAMLAALPPDVKRALKDRHLLMPTLQMLLRRHYEGVESDEDYLSGRAHPPVFEGAGLRTERMVRAAHEMSLMTLPPWAEIRVLEEDRPRLGLDYFEAPGRTEETLTTPAAVARIFRGTDFRRRYVLSAERSGDPNGRPLTFHWRLLQGDPTRVSIRPMGERGERAEITVAWHSPMPAASEPNVMSSRVDLALFAHNGAHFSAPAFFCVYFPPCEERRYDENGRLQSVRYRRGASAPYTDPAIYTPREWTDTYEYDAEGRLAGWTRLIGPQQERYDAQGRRMSADGTAQEVAYRVVPEGQAFRLEPSP